MWGALRTRDSPQPPDPSASILSLRLCSLQVRPSRAHSADGLEAARAAVRSLVGAVPVFVKDGEPFARVGLDPAPLLEAAGIAPIGSGGPLRDFPTPSGRLKFNRLGESRYDTTYPQR